MNLYKRWGVSLFFFLFFDVFSSLSHAQLDRLQTIPAEKAENFSFIDATKKRFQFEDFKGKIVILNFWATWCRFCIDEMSSLEALADQFDEKDLVVLALCKDKDKISEAKDIFESRSIKHMKLFFDETGQSFKDFKVKGLPTTLIFNRQGELIGRLEGATAWDHWEVIELAKNLISGKTPETQSLWQRWTGKIKRIFS